MTKKVKKTRKRKFNFKRFFKFLLFLVCLILLYLYFSNKPIKNIIIKGNYYLSDETIIELAGIENYPSFLKTFSSSIKNKVKKNSLVKDVNVKKKLGYKVVIEIEEEKVLFKMRSTNEYVLGDNTRLEELIISEEVPVLINFVPDDVLNKLIDKMSLIDRDVLIKISEIEYSPNPYDNERFIFYMNDENEVFITLNKIKEFNKYNKIKEQIANNKGILYLDSGNYFEIKN